MKLDLFQILSRLSLTFTDLALILLRPTSVYRDLCPPGFYCAEVQHEIAWVCRFAPQMFTACYDVFPLYFIGDTSLSGHYLCQSLQVPMPRRLESKTGRCWTHHGTRQESLRLQHDVNNFNCEHALSNFVQHRSSVVLIRCIVSAHY